MSGKILNVLIVEDEALTRVFLKRLVLSYGHNVVAVPSEGKEALKIIKENDIDLIFMDINIKGSIDGITVVKQMQTKSNPIIYFISAYSDKDTISEALSTHAYHYIIKPIKESDINIAFTVTQNLLPSVKDTFTVKLASTLIYDKQTKELYDTQNSIQLTRLEKLLIDLFASNLNINISYEMMLHYVWEGKEVSSSTIRSTLSSLRKKLPSLPITTNVGRGYILRYFD
jgi:DNA-binding response OmpR family regulator